MCLSEKDNVLALSVLYENFIDNLTYNLGNFSMNRLPSAGNDAYNGENHLQRHTIHRNYWILIDDTIV